MSPERTNDKLARFRAWLGEQAKAHPVPPAAGIPRFERRHSGPTHVPSDWMAQIPQQYLGPQCQAEGCHQNLVRGQSLVDGKWCGTCAARYSIPRRLAMGGDDSPAA